MTTSNCMTCIYGGSWTGEQSTEPGHCYMFKDEPEGVCGQWKHSVHDESAANMPDCWVVVKNGQILGTHDEPAHIDGLQAVRYVPAQPTPRTAGCTLCGHCAATGEKIHAAQPVREPLTDEQIAEIASTPCAVVGSYVHSFARAIERAHGIGGDV